MPSASEARSEPASRTRSSTSPAGRFETWMVSGRVVALSGAVTTRLQPVCLAIALSASRTVPRGWARETTGELSRNSALQPTAVRRGRPGEAGQTHECDGENDDQLGCAHVRSPFVREYGRACRLFHEPE